MGIYINPDGMSKGEFLREHGIQMSLEELMVFEDFRGDFVPVVLIANAHFTAAAVAYDRSEAVALTLPDDPRPKLFFLVEKDHIRPHIGRDTLD